MKKKICAFLAVALFALMVAPIVNLSSGTVSGRPKNIEWWDTSVLYNMDFALPLLGGIYYSLGISLSPEKVVIGKDGWLFLGDGFGNAISAKRKGVTSEDEVLLDKVADSGSAWEAWYKKNGVKAYRVIIGPDKDSIYHEKMPAWASHASPSLTDALMKKVRADIYINPKKALLQEKEKFNKPLYYKTDTHWNSLGAWVAFNQLSENLSHTLPEISWPDRSMSNSLSETVRLGGDLANFQRIENYITDQEIVLNAFSTAPIPVEQYEFKTGKLLISGNNSVIGAPRNPLLVTSTKALNHKKVLWIRDSFGTAMAPYFAATFTETLQIHLQAVTPEIVASLVKKFKPDFIFVTTVERDSLYVYFNSFPPMSISDNRDEFSPLAHGYILSLNDFSAMDDPDSYKVTGNDPFIVFKLSKSVKPNEAEHLAFELNCLNSSNKIPVQLLWREKNTDFSETNSVYISANQGVTSVDISVNPAWAKSHEITDLRLDLESPSGCQTAKIKNFEVGLIRKPKTSD